MDRSAKRKASSAAAPALEETRPNKRQHKNSESNANNGSPNSVSAVGLRFLEQLNRAVDKRGNLIASAFLELPSKKALPDYYKFTKEPIALDIIERKLHNDEYSSLSELETDVKLMVNNAKAYNEPGSAVHDDAERIRKNTSNWMKINNKETGRLTRAPQLPESPITPAPPAARTIRLIKKPTPQEEANESPKKKAEKDTPKMSPPQQSAKKPERPESAQEKSAQTGIELDKQEPGFEGMTFQQAQDKILEDCVQHTDEGGELAVFTPFVYLPSRKLTDYYELIRHPVSLKGTQKKVRGIKGRDGTTGVTEFKTWDAFEREVSFIWNNAREYNEDGSPMYTLSEEFEQYFKRRLSAAKQNVEEPQPPSLKLNMGNKPSGLTLKLGAQKMSPTPSQQPDATVPVKSTEASTPRTGGTSNGTSVVDKSTTLREQASAEASNDGQTPVSASNAASAAITKPAAPNGTQPASTPQGEGEASAPAAGTKTTREVKPELPANVDSLSQYANSLSALANSIPSSNAVNGNLVPPPSRGGLSNGTSATPPAPPQSHVPTPAPFSFDNSRWRHKDQSPLLTNLIVSTPPDPMLPRPLRISVPPHRKLTQQSVTLTLPSGHRHIAFQSYLAPALQGTSGVPYKMFATVNGSRIAPRPVADSALVNGEAWSDAAKSRGPAYDAWLLPGTNRIEIECVVATDPPVAGAPELQIEKISVYVHLMRG